MTLLPSRIPEDVLQCVGNRLSAKLFNSLTQLRCLLGILQRLSWVTTKLTKPASNTKRETSPGLPKDD
ncbi:hypothetical protein GJ744_004160 [Endocarpon pusillum]|uniref:Uncharacterized protein n=1 Tax=Endocarpon pusillum TaxID=364733 RepID=A0A8H7E6X8_9EURO|nr:hypothetical protein GJ744_004160 [Endocarpon pusillum]